MRTLDEMIKDFELEELYAKGRYEGGGWYLIGGDELADAINYLRGYRDSKAWLDLEKNNYAKSVDNCEKAEAKYTKMILDNNRNDPLTWDELTQMEGKPVWVECKFYSHQWAIIGEVTENRIRFYGPRLVDGEPQEEMGETWNAYRKERE